MLMGIMAKLTIITQDEFNLDELPEWQGQVDEGGRYTTDLTQEEMYDLVPEDKAVCFFKNKTVIGSSKDIRRYWDLVA